jgi:hypothetical protein
MLYARNRFLQAGAPANGRGHHGEEGKEGKEGQEDQKKEVML